MRSFCVVRQIPLLALVAGCGGGNANSTSHPATAGSGGGAGTTSTSPTGGTSSTAGSSGTGPVGVITGDGGIAFKNDSFDCPTPPKATTSKLTAGMWTDLTPKAAGVGTTNGVLTFTNCVGVDPCNPDVIYTCTSGFNMTTFDNADGGVWKSTDAGATWTKIAGKGVIDSPAGMAIGPNNHAYVTDGVRGQTLGFWRTNDGGATWNQPEGFKAVAMDPTVSNNDVSSIAVDRNDFKHVLVGYHGGWTDHGTYTNRAGLIESTDAGDSWTIHAPPSAWTAGSQGVNFLYSPTLKVGDKNTWLVTLDGVGFWRTPDAGKTWSQVSNINAGHGGTELYYASTGVVYAGATPNMARSTDNGVTWTPITQGVPGSYYFSVVGDGTSLYTMPDYNNGSTQAFITSPETDGQTWTEYANSPKLTRGPFKMTFDPVNRIVYSANWDAGLYALKVP